MDKQKAIVVFSGGQDSTTCLFLALSENYDVHALTIDYGQRHNEEIHSAIKIARMAGVPHEIIPIGDSVLKGTSPLVNKNEKLEQYKDHASLPGGIEKTFVPMRNQLFLTIAMNRASAIGAKKIFTGVCEEDYGGYPDCRRSFIDVIEIASNVGLIGSYYDLPEVIQIVTPLMKLTKKETVRLALVLPGCYAALAHSHTAYDGKYPPLGKDHATILRAKGFEEANVPDPLVLRAFREGLMPLPDSPNYKLSTDEMYGFFSLAGL